MGYYASAIILFILVISLFLYRSGLLDHSNHHERNRKPKRHASRFNRNHARPSSKILYHPSYFRRKRGLIRAILKGRFGFSRKPKADILPLRKHHSRSKSGSTP